MRLTSLLAQCEHTIEKFKEGDAMNKQNETKLTPGQIADSIIRGYETDSGVVMGIGWMHRPALRALLIEAATQAVEQARQEIGG
jgi:hypothetical protein